MDRRPGRSAAFGAGIARGALGVALAALAFAAFDLGHQRSSALLLAASLLVLAAALASPGRAAVATCVVVALLPIAGNLLRGPWVAPAEALLLLLAAATLVRHRATGPSPLARPLAFSAAAVAVGAAASTLAALGWGEVPGAVENLARSFFAPDAGHAALPIRAALVHAAGLFAYLLLRRAAEERGGAKVVAAAVAGLALVGVYAVLEATTGLKLWGPELYEARSLGLRVPSTLPDYNATGAAMALGLFPAVVFARQRRGLRRLAWWGAAAFLLAALILSGSRTAWLAALVASGAVLAGALAARGGASRVERRRLVLGPALALAVVVVAFAAWPGGVGQLLRRRAATLLDPGASVRAVRAGRLGFWIAGVRMVAAHPLAGVGPGRVPSRFEEFRRPGFPVDSENLHNYFLQAIAEDGVPGGVLALWPFVPLALLAGRLLRRGEAFSSPAAALAPGLVAFSLTGLASHPWLLPEMQFLFWGCAALLPEPAFVTPAPRSALLRRLPLALLLVWGGARLLVAPGTERGRWGYAEWSARGGPERESWTGPRALVPVGVPDAAVVRVRLRATLDDITARPALVSVRLDGGPARLVSLADRSWHDVSVERGPYRPGRDLAPAPSRGLLALESSRSFCPSRDGAGDRRVLSLQLARPPLAPAGRTSP